MTSSQANTREEQVTYTQRGESKTVAESQAIYMLESIAQKDTQRALAYYLKLTSENPNAQNLLWKFYNTLLNMHMFEELREVCDARLKKIPGCTVSFSCKIDALQYMFRHDEAIELLAARVQGNPENLATLNLLGMYQKDVGDFAAANKSFSKAIAINSAFAPAYWHRSEYSTDPEADLAAVRAVISGQKIADDQSHYLHFTAYRLSERLEQYDEAFEHLQIANTMRRRNIEYQVEQDLAIDQQARKVFNPERIQKLPSPEPSELSPIFIMGMPRSGTTLVEQIIASHSEVAAGDEYTALANAAMRAQRDSSADGSVTEWLERLSNEDCRRIAKYYEHNMRFVRGDKKIFTDKNQFNHRSIALIKASLANAKIIVVERQAMDVALGCYRQLFGGIGSRFSYQFNEIAQFYQSYMSLLDYWESVSHGLILRIRYEDLVRDQARVSKEMLSFCNLDWQDQCLDFHKTQRTVKTLSSAQVRRPIFTEGIDRWKRYETQLAPMVAELKKVGIA